jgi:hypothetical protein
MKRFLLSVSLLLIAALLAGCFQTERTIHLKPDGSGTVEELVFLNAAMAGMMAMDTGEEKGGEAKEKAAEKKKGLFSDADGKARAATMGEGVTFVSFKPEKKEGFEGYRAVYAFKDINKLKLSSDPEMPGDAKPEKKSGQYQFKLTKGKQTVLLIQNSNPKGNQPKAEAAPTAEEPKSDEAKKEEEVADEAGAEMAKMLFNGMRFADRIIIEGNVVESNATYRSGKEIILIDVDFAKAMSFTKELTKLQKAQASDDSQQAKEIMKKIPGFKVDLNDELKVVFK